MRKDQLTQHQHGRSIYYPTKPGWPELGERYAKPGLYKEGGADDGAHEGSVQRVRGQGQWDPLQGPDLRGMQGSILLLIDVVNVLL